MAASFGRTTLSQCLPGHGLCLVLLRLVLLEPHRAADAAVHFSNVFQNSMVLQRNQPLEVWGYGAVAGETLLVTLDQTSGSAVSWTEATATAEGEWRATLSAPPAEITGVPLTLNLTRRGASSPAQSLADVVLGDVYLFSGQSNVDLPVSYVHQFNRSAEEAEERFAEELGRSGRMRIMIVPARCGLMPHDDIVAKELAEVHECIPCPPPFEPVPQMNDCSLMGGHRYGYTYCNCDSLRWSRPTAASVRGFSALAWFTGRALLDIPSLKGVPVGLVRSSWGATNIAVWSGPDALVKCPQPGEPPSSFAPYVRSALYAKMIHPLGGLQFSAIIWMHGARNVGGSSPYMGGDYYSCALRAMIADWREKLRLFAVPFLVVESPIYCNELDYKTWHTWCDDKTSKLTSPDYHLPEIRMAQTEAEALPNVYVVSVIDQGSLKQAMGGAIHSERKPELGRRVVLALRSAVYKDQDSVWSGPTAAMAWQTPYNQVVLCFDTRGGGELILNTSARCPPVVLPVYCTGSTFEVRMNGTWINPTTVSLCNNRVVLGVPGRVQRVRYAWADWPVNSLTSASGIPARIFNMNVRANDAGVQCPKVPRAAGNRDTCTTTTVLTTTAVATVAGVATMAPLAALDATTTTTTTFLVAAHASSMRIVALIASLVVSLPLLALTAYASLKTTHPYSCIFPWGDKPKQAKKTTLELEPSSKEGSAASTGEYLAADLLPPTESSISEPPSDLPSTFSQSHTRRSEVARLMSLAAAPVQRLRKGRQPSDVGSEEAPLMEGTQWNQPSPYRGAKPRVVTAPIPEPTRS